MLVWIFGLVKMVIMVNMCVHVWSRVVKVKEQEKDTEKHIGWTVNWFNSWLWKSTAWHPKATAVVVNKPVGMDWPPLWRPRLCVAAVDCWSVIRNQIDKNMCFPFPCCPYGFPPTQLPFFHLKLKSSYIERIQIFCNFHFHQSFGYQ